jgi:hypothetical protein
MIRGTKGVDWTEFLQPEDTTFLENPIDLDGWYPMVTFERFGIAILRRVAHGQLAGVEMWGGFQVDQVRRHFTTLLAEGDPRETLMRFNVLSKGFFDYEALKVESVVDDHAVVRVAYGMGRDAEETACHQSLGFFTRLVEVAGAKDVVARFKERSWKGDDATRIEIYFTGP